MTKRFTVLLAAAFLLVFFSAAISSDLQRVKEMPAKLPFITGEEVIPDAEYYPSMPGLTLSMDTAGITQYDYQTNGSTGNRIVVDAQSNVHVAWMKGSSNNGVRHIYYNCKTLLGWIAPGTGQQVSVASGAGYTTMDVMPDDRGVMFYHRAPAGNESLFVAIDAGNCQGFFDYAYPPNRLTTSHRYIWPYGTVDNNGFIHVTATWNNPTLGGSQDFIYTRSNNGGTTWTAIQRVDTVETISPVIVSSPVSSKVAIVYCHPTDTASQVKNDIYYIISNDGSTWDFRNGKINATEYGAGDSLFAYTDVDAVFDYNDNLNIVWNAQYVSSAGGIYYLDSQLLHFDVTDGAISQIHNWPDTLFPSACDMGGWNFTHAKMSIASDLRSNLYVTYTSWDSTDCSAGGYANGDIYLHYSTDGGAVWSNRVNLTNSQSPMCEPGDCESDHWSSLAEKVDTAIHLVYINDRDAGGFPQTEGAITNNPVVYLSYSQLPPLLSVDDGNSVPRNFTLSQNYPNPFNASTNIEFELSKASRVELSVYDITGARVATLLNGDRPAGKHQINWDASAIASGVYYYTLRADGAETSRKMTLLK
jgi:hypothetical protein